MYIFVHTQYNFVYFYLIFPADCNNVGDGVLEATVTYNERSIPVEVFERHPRMHVIKFTPEAPGTYKTRVFYDGREAKCKESSNFWPFLFIVYFLFYLFFLTYSARNIV